MCLSTVTSAQTFPKWFIEQGKIPCSNVVVMFYKPYYKDSIKPYVKYYTAISATRNEKCRVVGAVLNWKTEVGTYAVSSYDNIEIDTSKLVQNYKRKYYLRDYFVTPNNSFFGLVTYDSCDIPKDLMSKVKFGEKYPSWLENLPEEKGYDYCVGLCDKYYFDYRTWEEAEKHALKQIIRSKFLQTSALMKTEDNTADEIIDQKYDAEIKNLSVVSRWIDKKADIYYVLVKIRK